MLTLTYFASQVELSAQPRHASRDFRGEPDRRVLHVGGTLSRTKPFSVFYPAHAPLQLNEPRSLQATGLACGYTAKKSLSQHLVLRSPSSRIFLSGHTASSVWAGAIRVDFLEEAHITPDTEGWRQLTRADNRGSPSICCAWSGCLLI